MGDHPRIACGSHGKARTVRRRRCFNTPTHDHIRSLLTAAPMRLPPTLPPSEEEVRWTRLGFFKRLCGAAIVRPRIQSLSKLGQRRD